MWLQLVLAFVAGLGTGWECGVTPAWEKERSAQVERARRLQVGPAFQRSATLGPIRIYAHYGDMSKLSSALAVRIQTVLMPTMVAYYANTLSIYPLSQNWVLAQTTCGSQPVPTDHQTTGLSDVDLVLYVFATTDPGSNYVARSGACGFDGGSWGSPIAGTIEFNAAKYVGLEVEHEIELLRHEVAHTLAFAGFLFPKYRQSDGTLYPTPVVDTTTRGNPVKQLTTPKVVAKAKAAFGCSTLTGLELENDGGTGTAGSHWEKRIMMNDFMVGTLMTNAVYSDITLAAFEDSGWYTVNYDYTDQITFGKNRGCDFFTSKCVGNGIAQFPEFCSAVNTKMCGNLNTKKSMCNLSTFTSALPTEYQYFSDTMQGGSDVLADFCPYVQPYNNGDCTGVSSTTPLLDAAILGEEAGSSSRCFTGTYIKSGYALSGDPNHTGCHKVTCAGGAASVLIGTYTVLCPVAGGQVTSITGFDGYINCPLYDQICGPGYCLNGCFGYGKCVGGQCLCNDGFSGPDCSLICDLSCRKCSGIQADQCSSCYSNATLSSNICTCDSGFLQNSTTKKCAPPNICHATCLTCSGPINSECLTCVNNASLIMSKFCSCDIGYVRSGDLAVCIACDPTCLTCQGTTASSCLTCKINAHLSGAACVCDDGYYMNGSGFCTTCSANCSTCNISASTCSSCDVTVASLSGTTCNCLPTAFRNNTNEACQSCHVTCTSCSAETANSCLTCEQSAVMTGGACMCNSGYMRPADLTACVPCHVSCLTCTSQQTNCLTCKFNAFPMNGVCICNPGFFQNADFLCQPCNTMCQTCTQTECITCKPANTSISSGTCICNGSFYLSSDGALCVPCHSVCFTCVAAAESACLACYGQAILTPSNGPGVCSCSVGFYYLAGTDCKQCAPTCWTCANEKDCSSCYGTATLQGSLCVCGFGYFLNTVARTCSQCDQTCETCNSILATGCISCKTGMTLSGTSCLCNSGSYLDTSNVCIQCNPSCLSCNSGNYCISCGNFTSLSLGICSCLDGYFPSQSAINCQPCHFACKTCQGSLVSNCISCYPNAVPQGGVCFCQPGFYPNPDSSHCQSCDPTCKSCLSDGLLGCLTCYSPANLADVAPNSCICPPHFYPNPSALVCSACAPLCLNCITSSPQSCTSCDSNSNLSAGQCTCKSRYFLESGTSTCQSCAQFCQSCTGPAPTQCTSCPTGLQLIGSSTVSCSCPNGEVPNSVTEQCLQCHVNCLTCVDAGANQCTKCVGSLQLLQGVPGYCGCGLGNYMKTDSCEICDISCSSCKSSTASDCTGCKAGAQLSAGKCACALGYFPAPTAANCSACPQNCLNCSNAEICWKCSEGFFLVSQQCLGCKAGCLTCSDSVNCLSCISSLHLTLKGECVDCPSCAQPFTASVSSPYDHKYLISFNHNCTYPFLAGDLAFATEPESNLTWAVETAVPLLVSIHGGPWYTNTTFHLSFPHPKYIFDIFGASLSVSSLLIPSPAGAVLINPNEASPNTTDSELPSNSTSTLSAEEQSVAATSQQSTNALAAGALAAGAMAGSSAAMALVTQMQYFSFIGSTGVSLPGGMAGMYAGMNQKSMLPNFFSRKNTGRRLSASEVFDFLEETGSFLSLFVLLFGLHLLVRLISLPCIHKQPKWLSWALTKFEWSLYLDFLGFAYLDLTLNSLSMLHRAEVPSSDVRNALNMTLAVSVLLLMVIFPLYTFGLIRKNREHLFVSETLPDAQVKVESGVRKKWEKLVNGIREDVVFAQYFQPVSYAQRFVYAFILVFLDPGKWLCLGLIFPSLWITAFVVVYRPDDSAAQRFLRILTEVQTLFLFISIFLIKVLTSGTLELGWTIVVLSMGAMACGVVSFLLDIRGKIVSFFRKTCCKKENAAITAEAYEVNTAAYEDRNSSILSTSSLYPSEKERRLRGVLAALAWAPAERRRRLTNEVDEKTSEVQE